MASMRQQIDRVLSLLPAKPQPGLVRYGWTSLFVLVFFVVLILVRMNGGGDVFFIMVPAIFLSAVLFDRGSGFLATGLATVLLMAMIERQYGFIPRSYVLPLLLFFLLGLAVAAVSEALRKGWELALSSERAKDLLYRELGHRTKNDLATAAAILGLQARQQQNPETKAALTTAVGRLQVLGKAHEHFEPAAETQNIRMRDYLESICGLLRSGVEDGIQVDIKNCDEIVLPTERAIPVGLIVNELVTNAFKHAFSEGTSGSITVKCDRADSIVLTVEDNGKGCPDGEHGGLGSRLIDLLVEQLGGKLRREDAKPGCRVIVDIPEEAEEA